IPREIIKLIVRCMLRDIPDNAGSSGTFYQSDPKYAYTSEDNIEAAAKISKAVEDLLLLDKFGLPKEGFPFELRTNLLFKLRSLMYVEAPVDASVSQAPSAVQSGGNDEPGESVTFALRDEDTTIAE